MRDYFSSPIEVWDADEYVLSLPYGDDRELVRDVMKYVPDVVVEAPSKLKHSVMQRLQHGLEEYCQS